MPGNRLTLLCCLEGSTPEDGYLTRRRISLWIQGSLFVLPTAVILFSGGLEGPARQDWELRHRAAAKTRLEQRPMTEGPRRNASQAPRNFLIYFFHKQIRPIRGRKTSLSCGILPSRQHLWWAVLTEGVAPGYA